MILNGWAALRSLMVVALAVVLAACQPMAHAPGTTTQSGAATAPAAVAPPAAETSPVTLPPPVRAEGEATGATAGATTATPPGGAPDTPATTSEASGAGPTLAVQSTTTASDLRVFLADAQVHPGWTPVPLKPSGLLYVDPQAVIGRSDLMGIQAARDQEGGGLLVLILTDDGLRKLREATANNPGLRLALVVGQTMLAAPSYAAPVHEQQLAFAVGTFLNAQRAAQAVAGVQAPNQTPSQAPNQAQDQTTN